MIALTDTRLRTLRPAKGATERLVADGNGLYVRCRLGTKGDVTRAWQFRRRDNGRLTITALGVYPEVTIKQARLRAAELANKRSIVSPTVEEAAEQWMRERVDITHRQADAVRGYVDRALIPELGTMRVRDVEPSDIAGMIRAYRARVASLARARAEGRPAARALLAACKGLFSYAVAVGWLDRSPAAQLTQAIIGAPPVARSRVLGDDEIRTVMTTDATPGPVLRFLLLTGLRIGEAYNGQRDGQHWVVPAGVSKNKREHRVWLSTAALAQLESYPWAVSREAVQNWVTHNAGGWVAHDLRRTFATRNNEHGVAPHIVEKMLNHSLGGIAGIYNRADYGPERQEALEQWSAWLIDLVGKRPAGVVSLRAASAA